MGLFIRNYLANGKATKAAPATPYRMVIIYLPNGNEAKWCTKDVGPEYQLAREIICDLDKVDIIFEQDGKIEGESYVRMPYLLQMF